MVRKARKYLEKKGLKNEKMSVFLNEKYKDDAKRKKVYDLMTEISRPPYHYLNLHHIGTSYLDGRPDNFFDITYEGKKMSTPSAIIFHDMNRLLTLVFTAIGSLAGYIFGVTHDSWPAIYNPATNIISSVITFFHVKP